LGYDNLDRAGRFVRLDPATPLNAGRLSRKDSLQLMKQVIAVVQPFQAEKVLEALEHAPIEACGISEVKGYGRQKSYLDEYRGSEYSLAYLPKVEITLWVDDPRVDEVVRTIVETARTGRMGDGKVFVMPVLAGEEW
jgi:nitrogen regulatory protein PII